jgi:hypothetical protein
MIALSPEPSVTGTLNAIFLDRRLCFHIFFWSIYKERLRMVLSLKGPETDSLARQVAKLTGESLMEAVRGALRLRLRD